MKILKFLGEKKQQDISPWLEIFGSTQYMGINSGEQNYNIRIWIEKINNWELFLDKIELMVVNEKKNRFNMYIFNKSEKNSILKEKQFENCKMFEKNYLNRTIS